MRQMKLLPLLVGVLLVFAQFVLAASKDPFKPKPFPISGTAGAVEFLHVDEAFRPNVILLPENRLQVEWVIADGYYLYKHRFRFEATEGVKLGSAEIPAGLKKEDEFFGDVEVYYKLLSIMVPFQGGQREFELTVGYQGCADAGLCYPPESKSYRVDSVSLDVEQLLKSKAGKQKITSAGNPPGRRMLEIARNATTKEGSLAAAVADETLWMMMLLFFMAGIGLAFTPCVLPMVPILSSIIVGRKQIPTRIKAFSLSMTYVLGMAITYAVLGTLVGYFGAELNIQAKLQSPWILSTFALLFVILSLAMFGFYELQLPERLRDKLAGMSQAQQGGEYLGVAIMGVLSSLVVSPCISAPLAGALIYISATGDAVIGGLALLALGLGMGAPLVVIGSSGGDLLPRAGAWMNSVKAVFGVMLLAVAIWMVERIVPASVTLALWAVLAIVCGVYLGALDSVSKSGWPQLWKGVGVLSTVYGIILLIGAASGASDPLNPLQNVMGGAEARQETRISFRPVQDLKSLQQILETEAFDAVKRPTMLDFYADWCVSCKIMERDLFNDPEIGTLLGNFQLLQIDVTANNEDHQLVLNHFNLFGPPAILFFDKNGKELQRYRIQGELSRDEFDMHISELIKALESG
ncbi:MAG: protein-disulfide reductase DsbD [Gammaproteobacteria bacterium]|nr:protein-disulfide reductase DsbD [Gammaproteobacteria bacterium]